jgi:hypothetical protein
MPDLAEIPAYVKYDASGIVALLCKLCITDRERALINAAPNGLVPIPIAGAVICARCKEVAE